MPKEKQREEAQPRLTTHPGREMAPEREGSNDLNAGQQAYYDPEDEGSPNTITSR